MARVLTQETSLSRKRRSLLRESGVLGTLVKIEWAVGAVLVVTGAFVFAIQQSTALIWPGLVIAAVGGGHYLKIKQNRREEQHVQWGLQGEHQVTATLEEVLNNEHYIINDYVVKLGRKTAQIDHLVISPHGIFAIETKNWGGHIEGDENEDTWTQQSRSDRPPLKRANPIRQVKRHVEFLTTKLKQSGIDWPDIKGVVVFTSPKATSYVHNATMEILKPAEAAAAIARFKGQRTYTDEEVTKVVNLLMRGL